MTGAPRAPNSGVQSKVSPVKIRDYKRACLKVKHTACQIFGVWLKEYYISTTGGPTIDVVENYIKYKKIRELACIQRMPMTRRFLNLLNVL